MTLFAGIVSLRPGQALAEHHADVLRQNLSRDPGDRPRLLQGAGFVVAHANLGLLDGDSVWCDASGRTTLLAGEPLTTAAPGDASRASQVRALHDAWIRSDGSALRAARGSFSAVHLDPLARRVCLVADKLALRPLHYARVDGLLVFGTSLRILLALLPELGTRADLTAQAQLAALGYVLGERTPYAAIRSVEAGHCMSFDNGVPGRHEYWRWDAIATTPAEEDEFGRRLHEAFTDSVRLRLSAQRCVAAHLSGGLDSRCVVASLRHLGVEVHSINYAPSESMDLILGRRAARLLETRHFEATDGPLDFWDRMVASHRQWVRAADAVPRPAWPARIWSGMAGETVMAPVSMTDAMSTAMRQGRIDEAIDGHLERVGGRLPGRLFVRDMRQPLLDDLRDSMHRELARRTGDDQARRFHLYQMLNEMRGHLTRHYEDLDLRRIELVSPFWDSCLVALALSYPLQRMLRHRFYYRWLRAFPVDVAAVAWQAYPWSEPCPLPLARAPGSQWSSGWFGPDEPRLRARQVTEQFARAWAHPSFPDRLLNRWALLPAYWLARLGIIRYVYLLESASAFTRHALLPPRR